MISVEILSGGESEGGSLEETVCQETQTPQAVSNSHGDVEKSAVRLLSNVLVLTITQNINIGILKSKMLYMYFCFNRTDLYPGGGTHSARRNDGGACQTIRRPYYQKLDY